VASSAWQQTVGALALATAVSIVDISALTENIAWELDELQRLCPGRCILIGEPARIARWASEPAPFDPAASIAFNVAVIDAGNCVIRATTSDYKDQDGQLEVWSAELYLRRSASFEGHWLVSVKASDVHQVAAELKPGYYWAIARRDHGQVIGWAPNGNTFRVLVERGALQGEAINDMGWNVHVGELGAERLELISSEDGLLSGAREAKLSLFMWQFPAVFTGQ